MLAAAADTASEAGIQARNGWLLDELDRASKGKPSRRQTAALSKRLDSLVSALSVDFQPPPRDARQTLSRVLARPEFHRPVWESWRDRLYAYLMRLLERVLGRIPGFDIPSPGRWMSYALLALVVALAAIIIGRIVARSLIGRTRAAPALPTASQVTRITGWDQWLASARKFAADGRYADAIRAAYMACLMFLDARGLVEYRPWRTNGEYLRTLRERAAGLQDPMEQMTSLFEPVWYGRADAGPGEYEAALRFCTLVQQEAG